MLEILHVFLLRSFHRLKLERHNFVGVYNDENLVKIRMILGIIFWNFI